jgi:hypothetical protein
MKTIKIIANTSDVYTLYKRANTQAQRALLGYMAKTGTIKDPVFCGAFNVLRNIEWCMDEKEIYNLYSIEDTCTADKIIGIAQYALDRQFDSFAFSVREIDNIIRCMENI